jgi:hypothetical protein
MEEAICQYAGCRNRRKHHKTGLCASHRRMQLRGEDLRPLRGRSPLTERTCQGPKCDRPAEAKNLCREHGRQLRDGEEPHVIGDPAYRSRRAKERWAGMSPEAKAAHMAVMRAGLPPERTEEHIRRQAESSRVAWARRRQEAGPHVRDCLTCSKPFEREWSDKRRYCSVECRRYYQRLRRHGLTMQQYVAMLEAQGGVCGICHGDWKGWNGQQGPHIDHCHKTGRVRGLLCGVCNHAIAMLREDPVIIRRAADYLEQQTTVA